MFPQSPYSASGQFLLCVEDISNVKLPNEESFLMELYRLNTIFIQSERNLSTRFTVTNIIRGLIKPELLLKKDTRNFSPSTVISAVLQFCACSRNHGRSNLHAHISTLASLSTGDTSQCQHRRIHMPTQPPRKRLEMRHFHQYQSSNLY